MKKKFFVLTLIMVLILSIFSVKTSAANNGYSFAVTMTANNARVASGGEVLITVKISSLKFSDVGFNKFKAYINYDTNVFEKLTDSSIDGVDGWMPEYNVGTNLIQMEKQTFQKTDGEVMQISLKTKEGLEDGVQGEVKLTTIMISNSSDDATCSPVSTSITIGNSGSGPNIGNQTGNAVSNITPLNIPQTKLPIANNSTPVNNSAPLPVNNTANNTENRIQVANQIEDDMPYTGPEDGLGRIIIGVIFIALVIYIKIERMNKDTK